MSDEDAPRAFVIEPITVRADYVPGQLRPEHVAVDIPITAGNAERLLALALDVVDRLVSGTPIHVAMKEIQE